MTQSRNVVGIDVSKPKLDCYALAPGQARGVTNAAAGHRELIEWMTALGVRLVVLEATGGYERAVVQALRRAGLEVRVVDPKRVRQFARAMGRLAKNDRIDARMIAEFGAVSVAVAPSGVVIEDDPAREHLSGLLGSRQDLIEHQTSLQQQAVAAPPGPARRALQVPLKSIARAIDQLDKQIAAAIATHPPFAALARRLDTVPGIGPVAIAGLIAWLPELGRLERGQLAALVGIAPFDDDSAQRSGQRHIQGGRCKLRNVLYMAAMGGATRHNPVLHAYYLRLLQKGKEPKVAIIACLRKLLTILNTMIARQQDWQPKLATPAEAAA